MSGLKKLAGETAIYGVSSIVGKFLNWLLVPFYSRALASPGEYGVVTELYAWTALLIIILTYGMETGFFRFSASEPDEDKANRVYSTTLTSLAFTSTLFAILIILFSRPIATWMSYELHPEYIAMLGVAVAMDAFGSIPFSYLRFKKRPIKFASLKLIMIFANIIFNLFFLWVCPKIYSSNPEAIAWFYNPSYSVGYIFLSNLLSTTLVTILLLPYVFIGKFNFDKSLLKKMLKYSMPLVLFGIVGIMNQSIDKIILPHIYPDVEEGKILLGIYGACFKIAMVMMMFTYAFRFAYEPFVFAKHKDADSKETYADAMKYYVISSLFIYLFMIAYMDLFGMLLAPEYRIGMKVLPFVLMTYLLQGVFYNLSLWYKLIDKTIYGTWLSLVGLVITITINVLFIPTLNYMACAIASLISFIVMVLLSYFLGQKYFPIVYDLKRMGGYALLTLLLSCGMLFVNFEFFWQNILWRTLLVIPFVLYLLKKDLPLEQLPLFNKLLKKKD